jgi:hypothetical protein
MYLKHVPSKLTYSLFWIFLCPRDTALPSGLIEEGPDPRSDIYPHDHHNWPESATAGEDFEGGWLWLVPDGML